MLKIPSVQVQTRPERLSGLVHLSPPGAQLARRKASSVSHTHSAEPAAPSAQLRQPAIVDKLGQFHLLCPVRTVSLPGVLLASR